MSDHVFVGMRAAGLTKSPAFAPYSKVIAWYDDEHAFVAGDDTGRALEVDLPGATQATVDAMLESIRGFVYQPYEAADALLDPAAELGDGITVNGVYGPLASADADFDGLCTVNAAAPEDEEIDHEYPYQSPQDRAIKRKVTLGSSYYGTRITRANGLEIVKTAADGTEQSRVKLNADCLAFYDDDGDEALYFDPVAKKYKFKGMLDVSGNFIVDEGGNVTINGNINLSGGTITWGKNLPDSGISEDRARTIISSELVSSPTIAGGKFMDLQQQSYLQMGSDVAAGTLYGYMHMYVPAYSDDTPMFSTYCRYNQVSKVKGVALQASGTDFLVIDGGGMICPIGNWDFYGAHVYDLSVDSIRADEFTVQADDGDILLSCPGKMAIRLAANEDEIRFAVGGSVWILDADGLHQ